MSGFLTVSAYNKAENRFQRIPVMLKSVIDRIVTGQRPTGRARHDLQTMILVVWLVIAAIVAVDVALLAGEGVRFDAGSLINTTGALFLIFLMPALV